MSVWPNLCNANPEIKKVELSPFDFAMLVPFAMLEQIQTYSLQFIKVLISIKDTGIDFNPVIENDNLEFDNISVLNKIAEKIDYSRVLGLNSTVITIKN